MGLVWLEIERSFANRAALEERRDVELIATKAAERLGVGLYGLSYLVRTIAASVEATPEDKAGSFRQVAERLASREPAIRNLALADGFTIEEVFPLGANDAVIGRDVRELSAEGDTLAEALRRDGFVIDGPQPLVQGGSGIIVRAPVYGRREDAEALSGVVSIVVNDLAFFSSAGVLDADDTISIGLRRDNGGVESAGEADAFEERPILRTVDLPSGSWTIAAKPIGGWSESAGTSLVFSLFYVAGCAALLFLPGTPSSGCRTHAL